MTSSVPYVKLTCVSDYDDEVGGHFVGADERDLVVVRVCHRKLPLEDVQEAEGTDDLHRSRPCSAIPSITIHE